MKPEAYTMLAARQRTYWWHRARRSMGLALLRRSGIQEGCQLLDVGCGPGGNLDMLAAIHPGLVVGIDLSRTALQLARETVPDARLVHADISRGLPFAGATFDIVTIFNVLYHRWIPDERAVLREVFRVLRPGGLLLLTEPAFTVLEREMDELAMGRRRYRLREIVSLCEAAGLYVELQSYFTSFGFPILLATKLLGRRRDNKSEEAAASDMKPLSSFTNQMMYRLASMESRLIVSGLTMPFGVTLVCLARRPHLSTKLKGTATVNSPRLN
jgi:ubiquinone/menaquinone biosynthesis C-methylase UbiE